MGRLGKIRVFLKTGAGAGFLLFVAAILATLVANSPLGAAYEHIIHGQLDFDSLGIHLSLGHAVNDGLMAIFFLLVGLEIKRELLTGELSSVKLALLPTFAAIGGMLVPAGIFLALNHADELTVKAWAVPMATDIAFSLGVLALLGSRVPVQAKVFLTAVAIIDDLGAIGIIAFFYTAGLELAYLGGVVALFAVMLVLNRLGVRAKLPYLALGAVLWLCMLKSGVHATMAGVLTAMAIPHLQAGAEQSDSTPLMQLEHALHSPVTYAILPLFAFVNAGVNLAGMEVQALWHPLPLGITLGLLLGKPIGICLAVWLGVVSKTCFMPRNVDWHVMLGVSLLCGIGFTVSLFIGNLSFVNLGEQAAQLVNLTKAGVLMGSLLAGLLGFSYLRLNSRG